VRLALKVVMQNDGDFVRCNATVQVYQLSVAPLLWLESLCLGIQRPNREGLASVSYRY